LKKPDDRAQGWKAERGALSIGITLSFLVSASLICGCSFAKVGPQREMERSKAKYKACLGEHPRDTSACEGAREAFEADLQVWQQAN
jgi:hypothetical protein